MQQRFSFIVLALLFITITSFSQQRESDKSCSDVKNGTFSTKHGFLGFFQPTYIIQRESDIQVEVDSYGDKYIFNVEWIDDCSYHLILKEIVNNPSHTEFSDKPILVEIIEVTNKGYRNKITMNIDGSTLIRTTTMIRQNPNEFKHLQEYVD